MCTDPPGSGEQGRWGWSGRPGRAARLCGLAFAPLGTALLLACGGSGGRTPLVVYSPHGRDLLTLMERRFEAERPDVDVRWLDMGSQEVYDRVRSERANPQGDVWFGGPSTIFARGARDSLLDAYRPGWAAAVAPRARGPHDLYTAAYETPAVLLYASAAVPPDEAPKDWDDLLAPRWRDQVLIRDPLASGTMRAVWGLILDRAVTQTGDTGAGFAWLRRLDGQTKEYVSNPALLSEKLVRQEGLVTVWDLPDVLLMQARGLPVAYRFPRSGTVVIEDGVGVIRGARHGAAARAFVDFVGTVPMQLVAAREAFRLPARLDLPQDSLPEWLRTVREAMRVRDVNWQRITAQGADWMRYWDQYVRGTGSGTRSR